MKPCGRMDLQFKIGMGHKIYPVLFDEAVFIDKSVVDYQVKITKDGYKDLLTFDVEAEHPSDELAERIVSAVSNIMEVKEGIEEDLVSVPKISFVDVGTMQYAVKAKKIIDLRDNKD